MIRRGKMLIREISYFLDIPIKELENMSNAELMELRKKYKKEGKGTTIKDRMKLFGPVNMTTK